MPDACTVAIVAPSLYLSVTIEDGPEPGAPEIHVHAGGQGIWVARMLVALGERPVVCAPLGGETGRALRGLAREWGIDVEVVRVEGASPAYVCDRRSGERVEIARSAAPQLDRHELDALYGRVLGRALATSLCIVTGRWSQADVPDGFYRRLASDLAAAGVATVGDLHAAELDVFLDGGGLDWLKISDEELAADGRVVEGADEGALLTAARELGAHGARNVVVSRSERPCLALLGDTTLRVSGPVLRPVDSTGTGDSMTAALASAWRHGREPEDVLRLAWAAGAANVLRHGRGSADRDLIERLAEQVLIEHLDTT